MRNMTCPHAKLYIIINRASILKHITSVKIDNNIE